GDGSVLVAGGYSAVYTRASAVRYDPATNALVPTAGLLSPHGAHTATLLPSGEVLVAGGLGDVGAQAATELYAPLVPLAATIPVGQFPYGVGVDATTNRAYVAAYSGNVVSV